VTKNFALVLDKVQEGLPYCNYTTTKGHKMNINDTNRLASLKQDKSNNETALAAMFFSEYNVARLEAAIKSQERAIARLELKG